MTRRFWTCALVTLVSASVSAGFSLGGVADHLAVARLAPAQHALAIHDEGRAVRDVALFVEHAVRADDRPVDVAEQREGEPARASERLMAEGAVAADREQGGAARLQ